MPRFVLKIIGLMCGTSKDGIDAAIIKTNGDDYIQTIAGKSIDYHPIFSIALRAVEYALQQTNGEMGPAKINFDSKYLYEYMDKIPKNNSTKDMIDSLKQYLGTNISIDNITKHYTLLCNNLIKDLLNEDHNIKIDVIGDHGITLYHNPKNSITIQIANGQLLADLQHTPVINDFRINDVKHGGQGAPLAPIYHKALLAKSGYENWAVVNLGGTANITLKNSYDKLVGFDTGPANVFLDWYIRTYTKGQSQMDQDGNRALLGTIIPEFLKNLQNDAINYSGENYLEKLPPKSLCISNYNNINSLVKKEYNFNDVCATLSAFTAYCIIKGIELVKTPVQIIITCGGGARNLAIKYYLECFARDLLDTTINIISADEAGLRSKYMEAELCGYLAAKSLHGDPITFPGTTGCTNPTKGGRCYVPSLGDVSTNIIELLKMNPNIIDGYTTDLEVLGNI